MTDVCFLCERNPITWPGTGMCERCHQETADLEYQAEREANAAAGRRTQGVRVIDEFVESSHEAGAYPVHGLGAPVMKLCKDCRWIAWPDNDLEPRSYEAICQHPTSVLPGEPDLVTGVAEAPKQLACQVARRLAVYELCGPDGRHWEAAQ